MASKIETLTPRVIIYLAFELLLLSKFWFTISLAHWMKTNKVPWHFHFVVERILFKIAFRGTFGFVQWGLIETCSGGPNLYIMLLEQIFMSDLAPSSLNHVFQYFKVLIQLTKPLALCLLLSIKKTVFLKCTLLIYSPN